MRAPSRRADPGSTTQSPGSDTGRMNASSSETVALASTELTTPAKSTAKPTTPIAAAASQAERDASVPRLMNTKPTPASAACACKRLRIGPPKSTSSSSANEPNAPNVATAGLPITSVPRANMHGITIAARAARRSAENPGSRARTHVRATPTARIIPDRHET